MTIVKGALDDAQWAEEREGAHSPSTPLTQIPLCHEQIHPPLLDQHLSADLRHS